MLPSIHVFHETAVKHQRLSASPSFKPDRMTWIKPGFMWMMYRSGWATNPNQKRILAVHRRSQWLIDTLQAHAVLSVHRTAGKTKQHDGVVQWDPDHGPTGEKLERRAVQIGLRGKAAAEYAAGIDGPAVVRIEDVTPYVISCGMQVSAHCIWMSTGQDMYGNRPGARTDGCTKME